LTDFGNVTNPFARLQAMSTCAGDMPLLLLTLALTLALTLTLLLL
jgi:hypothetical protein